MLECQPLVAVVVSEYVMFKKAPETEEVNAPSPASYRAMVQTIHVSSAVRKRTLEDVLADPPKLPELTLPEDQEKAVAAKPD